MLKKSKLTAILSAILVLTGCAAPLASGVVSRQEAGRDYIPLCTNVAKDTAGPGRFTTEYYLTTWGSAIGEGAIAGAREALAEDPGVGQNLLARMKPPQQVGSATLVPRGTPPDPYCMMIDAPIAVVSGSLNALTARLRAFGYSSNRVSRSPLVYETSFVSRSHQSAKWLDRFILVAEPVDEQRSALIVQRDVFISRQGSPYIQAVSVGANEAWIMTEVQRLARR